MPDRREFLGAVAGVAAGAMLPAVAPLTIMGVPVVFDETLTTSVLVDVLRCKDGSLMGYYRVDEGPEYNGVDAKHA